jgi:hypothetical protein
MAHPLADEAVTDTEPAALAKVAVADATAAPVFTCAELSTWRWGPSLDHTDPPIDIPGDWRFQIAALSDDAWIRWRARSGAHQHALANTPNVDEIHESDLQAAVEILRAVSPPDYDDDATTVWQPPTAESERLEWDACRRIWLLGRDPPPARRRSPELVRLGDVLSSVLATILARRAANRGRHYRNALGGISA